MKFKNKVILITGAASGIGYACAESFAGEGAKIMLVDIKESITEVADELGRSSNIEISSIVADLSDTKQARAIVSKTVKEFGAIDVLINNAGTIITGDILDLSEENFDKVLNVNLKAYFIVAQEAAKQMVKQGTEGNIINMSSTNSVLAIPNQLAYAVSKGGVNQLTRVMAVKLAPYNIHVNGIGPGTIETDVIKPVMTSDEQRKIILSRSPIGRIGQPSEIASVALFLASDAASFMIGQTIYPDGGRLILNYTVPVEE